MGGNPRGKKPSRNRKKHIPSILSKKSVRSSSSNQRSNDFKSRFHLSLMEKKRELESTIRCLANHKDDINKYSADSMIDELDRADREMAAQAYYKFLDRKKNELKRINILIDRISNDQDFGICEECGKRIPEARLLIIPEAVLCVPCQKDLENFESRTSYTSFNIGNSRYRNSFDQEDDFYNIDDAGIITKPGSEPVTLIDMEEIDLGALPDDSEEENNPAQET
ncbi:TraR/DksA family transcriptional regulator [Thermodesulfobacteriota bacterium]